MKLRLSSLARADLHGVAEKVKEDNRAATADRVISRIVAAMHQLERFPEMGRPGRVSGTRELGVATLPFIVVYRLQSDLIAVVRVIHGSMRWPPIP